MQGKVALEEHFAIPETLGDSHAFFSGSVWEELRGRLLDIQNRRLREMDAAGIEMAILSLNAPAVQGVHDVRKAVDLARRANDFAAEQVALRPDRFKAFAALPMQDADAAAAELQRCMQTLGFAGALVNGFSQVGNAETATYYDGPEHQGFWAECERLRAPFYLHPRNPLPSDAAIYRGHEWLMGPTWAFAQQTAVHALRLMGSGLFDRHPDLTMILGHMGEGIPFMVWRVDNRNGWIDEPKTHRAAHDMAHYLRTNVYITTSGNFRSQSLIDTMLEVGADRVLFSSDWPFENMSDAATWFDNAPISETDRRKIGRDNAHHLFGLDG